jgi:hypothetical protein
VELVEVVEPAGDGHAVGVQAQLQERDAVRRSHQFSDPQAGTEMAVGLFECFRWIVREVVVAWAAGPDDRDCMWCDHELRLGDLRVAGLDWGQDLSGRRVCPEPPNRCGDPLAATDLVLFASDEGSILEDRRQRDVASVIQCDGCAHRLLREGPFAWVPEAPRPGHGVDEHPPFDLQGRDAFSLVV